MHLTNDKIADRVVGIVNKVGIRFFVETGVGDGTSLFWAAKRGLYSFSCDVDPAMIARAWTARAAYAEPMIISIETSESVPFLERLCPSLYGKTLFWLDAHFPDNGGTSWPLEQELAAIRAGKRRYQHDLILCDDMQFSCAKPDEYAALFSDTHTASVEDDILWLIPKA